MGIEGEGGCNEERRPVKAATKSLTRGGVASPTPYLQVGIYLLLLEERCVAAYR